MSGCHSTAKATMCATDGDALLLAATARSLFARGQGPHIPELMSQYWEAMSSLLTKLKMAFDDDVTAETTSALNQLTQLQGLLLEGTPENAAAIHLQLPRLTKLTLSSFGVTTVSLDCPQLSNLKLLSLHPLAAMSKLPHGIQQLRLHTLGDGSVPLDQMIPPQGLRHLSRLCLDDCPGQPAIVREAYTASRLTSLSAGHEWGPLLPSHPPWQ